MNGLDGYRNRIDSLAEARDDRDAARSNIGHAYDALCWGSFADARAFIAIARQHLDALALKIAKEAPRG